MRRRNEWIATIMAGVALAGCSVKDTLYCETDLDCADNPGRPYCDVAGMWPQSEHIGKTCIASPFDAGVPDPVDAAVDAPPIDAPFDGRPDATPPPDGPPADAAPCKRKIAFASNRTGNNEIFVMNEDGSDPVNLTNSAASDTAPIWSPDGNWIAFRSDRGTGGATQYFTMSATGGSVVQISTCTGAVGGLTWRFDSAYLVYECHPTIGYESDLYKVLRNGLLPENLTPTVVGSNANPSFSPDGQWLVFDSIRSNNQDIYKMDFAGANVARLTTDPSIDRNPHWSPDGLIIAFTSRENTTTPYDYPNLFTMNPDGSNQVQIYTPNTNGGPWSPDGTKIVSNNVGGTGVDSVVVMDANGGAPTRVSSATANSNSGQWAPDSSKVVFASLVGQSGHVFVSNTNGTSYLDLTPSDQGTQPSWQPVCQ